MIINEIEYVRHNMCLLQILTQKKKRRIVLIFTGLRNIPN